MRVSSLLVVAFVAIQFAAEFWILRIIVLATESVTLDQYDFREDFRFLRVLRRECSLVGGKRWWSQGTIVEWRKEQQQIITWTQVRHSIHMLRTERIN